MLIVTELVVAICSYVHANRYISRYVSICRFDMLFNLSLIHVISAINIIADVNDFKYTYLLTGYNWY